MLLQPILTVEQKLERSGDLLELAVVCHQIGERDQMALDTTPLYQQAFSTVNHQANALAGELAGEMLHMQAPTEISSKLQHMTGAILTDVAVRAFIAARNPVSADNFPQLRSAQHGLESLGLRLREQTELTFERLTIGPVGGYVTDKGKTPAPTAVVSAVRDWAGRLEAVEVLFSYLVEQLSRLHRHQRAA